ncbi:MAG: hypothetical protein OS130_02885 [Thermodesulfobacteriota bacterium]|nr:MAG: hypothetical protein OS130_02885 [Thermodesulfobacteriota bacterium]
MKAPQLPRRSRKKHTLTKGKDEYTTAFGLTVRPYGLVRDLGFGVIVYEMFRSVITGQAKCLAS